MVGSSEVFSVVGESDDAVVVVVGDAVVCRNGIVSMLAIPIPHPFTLSDLTLSWARSSIQWQGCV